MRASLLVVPTLLMALFVSAPGPSLAHEPAQVSFTLDVLPLLTKAGCNSGKCHGTPTGKGGFALSLRGFDVAADHARLTRDLGGRRISLSEPEQSLILLKASATIPHGGGLRLAKESEGYRLLHQWIVERTPLSNDEARPVSLNVEPPSRWLESNVSFQQLHVMVRYADGRQRDVTHLARLEVSDEEAATISDDGLLSRAAGGEVSVSAEYAALHATAQVVFLPDRPRFVWSDPPTTNEIDRLVSEKLRRLRINPSELCDDATFLRRVSLDLCGRLPEPDEVRSFLVDHSPGKRELLVDRLLQSPAFADHWAMKWADRLGCNQRFVGKIGAHKYFAWIRHQIAANVPEDRFVRQIVTASGGNYEHPPAGFYRLPRSPEDRAEQVAQVFLGVRIGCARCHNHPGERWTQDDYYGLAACFAQMKYRDGPFFIQKYDKEETVLPARGGEVSHGRTGQRMTPKPLSDTPRALSAEEGTPSERRELLAEWLVSPENPFFARAAVNRIWQHLFGRGIVEPVDDFRSSNPPSHPELLDWLAARFVDLSFDRKALMREIVLSRTYQLSSQPNDTNAAEDRYFSRAYVRRLGAEQLLDCIGQATGVPERFNGFPAGTRAVQLPDGELVHPFLSAFGRPARALACACERGDDSTLGQALELVGGDAIETKLRAPEGRLAHLLESGVTNAALVEELFLATLGRLPQAAEQARFVQRLQQASDRRTAAEDLLWSLLNHHEFLFQH
jgi:hypothetical protein